MSGSDRILSWLEAHVKSMCASRRKTLAAVVAAAMLMKGVGVLALGRAIVAGRDALGRLGLSVSGWLAA